MISYWNDASTVYHKTYVKNGDGKDVPKWEKRIYKKCFVRIEKTMSQNDRVQETSTNAIFRLPCSAIVNTGDVVVKGRVGYMPEIGMSAKSIINKNENAFLVKTVHINDEMPPKHVYVEGV